MKIKSLSLTGYRSYDSTGPLLLGNLNVIVGANNSGKSSILRALGVVQAGGAVSHRDVRVGRQNGQISMVVEDCDGYFPNLPKGDVVLKFDIGSQNFSGRGINSPEHPLALLPNVFPQNFVVPFYSGRKASGYLEDTRLQYADQVSSNFQYLPAKISKISNSTHPAHDFYTRACVDIIGYPVFVVSSTSGQQIGIYIDSHQTLAIDQMGDGVPHIIGLLADLSLSEGKLFLIEEPENDLHPRALKKLLELIVEKSLSNQFVITTHSNVVVQYLAAQSDSKIYRVSSALDDRVPHATIEEVPSTSTAKMKVLHDLGYSFSDFDLWEGWLILEESSAERIIRDYLIPWFAPMLSRVRLMSAGGCSEVVPAFNDFRRLFLFAHLEEAYKDKAWVRVDGDSAGRDVVEKLQKSYPGWGGRAFGCFDREKFEYYYPGFFAERVEQVLRSDRKIIREEKKNLLLAVVAWLDEDEERGREALLNSAGSVIAQLREIESVFRLQKNL